MANNKLQTKIAEYQEIIKSGAGSQTKALCEYELWDLYTKSLQGMPSSITRREWFSSNFGGKPGHYDANVSLQLLLTGKNGKELNESIKTLFLRVDAGILKLTTAVHLTRIAKKIAKTYNVSLYRVLDIILTHSNNKVAIATGLNYAVLLNTINSSVEPSNGRGFKQTIMSITRGFIGSTSRIAASDPFGQRLITDFQTNMTIVVDEFLVKVRLHKQEVSLATTPLVTREEFDWAVAVLGIDRKKMGDYGEDLRLDLIKKRFRQQAATVHPDRNPSTAAANAFQELTEAMEIINTYGNQRS